MFKQILMGTALIAAMAAFEPGVALAQGHGGHGGGGHMGGGGGAHFGGGGGFGGGHFGGGFARGGGGGFAHGGGMRSFAAVGPGPGMTRNAIVNRPLNNGARFAHNGNWTHGDHGWRHHRGWGWGLGTGLALGYGYYGYYDGWPYDNAYYDDGYYGDDYAYNDYNQCYQLQRYRIRGVWHVRTVNVCQ